MRKKSVENVKNLNNLVNQVFFLKEKISGHILGILEIKILYIYI